MGIIKCKVIARSYFWWPKIDKDIGEMCRNCSTCTLFLNNPGRSQIQPWPLENAPWSRIHLDFMGPIFGNKYLLVIDSYSKWPEVFKSNRSDANNVIKLLQKIFARFGLPRKIVSDNGPPCASREFSHFLQQNGIRQLFATPKHPQSNG